MKSSWFVIAYFAKAKGGYNSRDYHGEIDQIQNLINDLKTNPDSRRLMVNAWNVGELDQMVLPPCHYGFQVYTRELSEDERFCSIFGDLGPIYGKQWRSWGERKHDSISNEYFIGIDQIQNLINDLKTNPDSRRLMVNAWNVGELDQMVLPPCHYGFQVYTRELTLDERAKQHQNPNIFYDIHGSFNIGDSIENSDMTIEDREWLHGKFDEGGIPKRSISLMWNQRSVDTFLGLPFNIASYGLLLEIIAKEVNMVPDELIGNLGDTHLYLNHIEQAKEQIGRELTDEERGKLMDEKLGVSERTLPYNYLTAALGKHKIPKRTREPYPLPTLVMVTNPELKFDEYVNDNFRLVNYQSHPSIKAPLSN